jgi:hypothetical protein
MGSTHTNASRAIDAVLAVGFESGVTRRQSITGRQAYEQRQQKQAKAAQANNRKAKYGTTLGTIVNWWRAA